MNGCLHSRVNNLHGDEVKRSAPFSIRVRTSLVPACVQVGVI